MQSFPFLRSCRHQGDQCFVETPQHRLPPRAGLLFTLLRFRILKNALESQNTIEAPGFHINDFLRTAEGIGNFGGETDNWQWPRHAGDVSMLRAYVDKQGKPADHAKANVPYRPAHYLRLAKQGLRPGDLVYLKASRGIGLEAVLEAFDSEGQT